jgi:hypothetical protein
VTSSIATTIETAALFLGEAPYTSSTNGASGASPTSTSSPSRSNPTHLAGHRTDRPDAAADHRRRHPHRDGADRRRRRPGRRRRHHPRVLTIPGVGRVTLRAPSRGGPPARALTPTQALADGRVLSGTSVSSRPCGVVAVGTVDRTAPPRSQRPELLLPQVLVAKHASGKGGIMRTSGSERVVIRFIRFWFIRVRLIRDRRTVVQGLEGPIVPSTTN